MALSVSALASALRGVASDPETVAVATQNWADAFTDYFYNASVLGTVAAEGTLSAANGAMVGAMVSTNSDFPSAFQAGIEAFWGVVATSGATIWSLAPPISAVSPPPGLTQIAATVQATGETNASSGNTKAQAAQAFADAVHPLILGGSATQPGTPPIVSPIL